MDVDFIRQAGGVTRTLFDDRLPDTNRLGRTIARVELEVAWREDAVEIREDGRVVLRVARSSVPFTDAIVYLQLASHSNYPARSIHFEDLRVSQGEDEPRRPFPAAPGCENAQAR